MFARTPELKKADLRWRDGGRQSNVAAPVMSHMVLCDGRILSWSEFGDPSGSPMLYFHSQGGSRLEAQLLHEAALKHGFRLFAVDRPGVGGSSYRAMRGHSEFAGDLEQWLEHMSLASISVLAWAGGGPFALAFAQRCVDRVQAVTLMSPFAAMPVQDTLLMKLFRATVRWSVQVRLLAGKGRLDVYFRRLRERLAFSDRKILDNPAIYQMLRADAEEAIRQGVRGVAQDSVMNYREWDFDPSKVAVPVHLWQGGADYLTVPCIALRLQALIPGAVLHTVARQGHLFFALAADDILRCQRRSMAA